MGTQFNLGIGLLLLRSLLWACYIISIRNLVTEVEPVIAAAWIFLFATLLFLPTILLWGDIHKITEVPLSTNLILFGSGVLCVGLGHALNYTAIKYLGATLPTTLLLLTPFLAGILAYFICDETLTLAQIISGVVIIFGCWLIIRKVVTGIGGE
jgi:drug/metabolite transporter (DMT)-like permease